MSAVDGSEMDGYEALVSELRANPPVAPERLRQRVLEGAPAPRRQRSRKRRLTLVVVPAAIVLAVGAALVHGFVDSGSTNTVLAGCTPAQRRFSRVVHGQAGRTVDEPAGGDRRAGVRVASNTYGLDQTAGRNTAVDSAPQALKAWLGLGPPLPHDPEEPARACRRLAPGRGQEQGSLGQDERGVADRRPRSAATRSPSTTRRPSRARATPSWSCASRCRTRRPRSGSSPDSARSSRSRSRPRTCRRSSRTRRAGSARCGARSPSTRRRSRARRCPHRSGSTSRSSSNNARRRSPACGTPAPPRSRPGATASISLLLTTRNHAIVAAQQEREHAHRPAARLGGPLPRARGDHRPLRADRPRSVPPARRTRLVDPARAAAARGDGCSRLRDLVKCRRARLRDPARPRDRPHRRRGGLHRLRARGVVPRAALQAGLPGPERDRRVRDRVDRSCSC